LIEEIWIRVLTFCLIESLKSQCDSVQKSMNLSIQSINQQYKLSRLITLILKYKWHHLFHSQYPNTNELFAFLSKWSLCFILWFRWSLWLSISKTQWTCLSRSKNFLKAYLLTGIFHLFQSLKSLMDQLAQKTSFPSFNPLSKVLSRDAIVSKTKKFTKEGASIKSLKLDVLLLMKSLNITFPNSKTGWFVLRGAMWSLQIFRFFNLVIDASQDLSIVESQEMKVC